MARDAVATAFETKVGNPWNGLLVEGFDAVTRDPPVTDYGFIAVQFPIAVGSRPVLSRHFFEDGSARFILNIKVEVGKKQARQWADALADLLRAQKFDGVQTFEPDGPIETDNIDDGNYIAFALVVPYRYQFSG